MHSGQGHAAGGAGAEGQGQAQPQPHQVPHLHNKQHLPKDSGGGWLGGWEECLLGVHSLVVEVGCR